MPHRLPTTRVSPRGFTVLELLVVFGITCMLAGLLLPAIGAARESARRVACTNNLRQYGIALHAVHDLQSQLPRGLTRSKSTPSTGYGWCAALLGQLESPWQGVVDLQRPIEAPELAKVRTSQLPISLCPSDIVETTFGLAVLPAGAHQNEFRLAPLPRPISELRLPTASYIAVYGPNDPDEIAPDEAAMGPFDCVRPRRFREFARGLHATMLIGERTMAKLPSTWLGVDMRGEDAEGRVLGGAMLAPNAAFADECDFSSRHPGGSVFLWADSSVRLVSSSIDQQTYQSLSRLSDAALCPAPHSANRPF
ncbi:MAG: DUF1559 domain-containing protein [Planctomycetales bacterium]|nr:DUF1559 domain-containing protein [Planctomycetales bacterium]